MYQQSPDSVARVLGTDLVRGLTKDEARRRHDIYGPNQLAEAPGASFWRLLLDQFRNFLVLLLLAAALISASLGETIDAAAIMAIVVVNAALGVLQEWRAEQSLQALKRMAAPTAVVIRDGHQEAIPSEQLVPGDLVVLNAGNHVPADVRLTETANMRVQEAALTGESTPVEKNSSSVLDAAMPIGDRTNSAFMGTLVTYGRGKGIVTATGPYTQFGLIAQMLSVVRTEETPLQRRLSELGKVLGTGALAICAIIFLVGVVRDTQMGLALSGGVAAYLRTHESELVELFMTAISLAIAAVPEGLPAVVTICLALGMQRMVRRHALLRRLPAVETLGTATAICSDKTGTLTQNEMTVTQVWVGEELYQVTGRGYVPEGQFRLGEEGIDPRTVPPLWLLLQGALLCNDAQLERVAPSNGSPEGWRMVGDPTEGALVVLAGKAGLWRHDCEQHQPRVGEIPFDSAQKHMTTIHAVEGADAPFRAYVKGAPDVLLRLCSHVQDDGQVKPLSESTRQAILRANDSMAAHALRVLAVAYRPLQEAITDGLDWSRQSRLVFLGLTGMIDPARPEARPAVAVCREAGIKAVMITGDHKDTAIAIAKELDLLVPGHHTLTGKDLDAMSDEELAARAGNVDVYARVSPEHKVRIVEALKNIGHVVAMTGDGVNDAPALKRADIGIAMGITGTDVAKETADMILTDDNFASIVSAVEEGRIIYSNIRKFVYYLLSCNVGEILVIFLAMLAGLPLPLRPIHLLWLNLVTDGLPALALGLEAGEPGIMKRPPRPAREPIINREMVWNTLLQGTAITATTLGAFLIGLRLYPDSLVAAQTIAFVTLTSSELFRAYTSRSERCSLLQLGVFSNRYMVWATLSSFVLMLAVVYLPIFEPIFYTTNLPLQEWLLILPLTLFPSLVAEASKWLMSRRDGDLACSPAASGTQSRSAGTK
ncbi:MAG: cation-translocating P-type ATPase [Chloroflexi bacterium]|nr:cation-translocating P-type ATPase [Chloroflexota bacterium]